MEWGQVQGVNLNMESTPIAHVDMKPSRKCICPCKNSLYRSLGLKNSTSLSTMP